MSELTQHPDIQGLLFRSYKEFPFSAYGFFQVTDVSDFKAWLLTAIENDVFIAASNGRPVPENPGRLNIAFTASGLQGLLGDGWLPDTFEPSFVEGMVQDHRSRLLGDVEANDPANWRWGAGERVDGILFAFDETGEKAEQLLVHHLAPGNGAERNTTIYGFRDPSGEEVFGFRDGISQPVIKDTKRHRQLLEDRPREATLHEVPSGEFVLGYPDGTNRLPRSPATSAARDVDGFLEPHWEWPDRRDFGMNGSYLVFRQLAQDRNAFWSYLENEAQGDETFTAQMLAEKMVGRRMNGDAMEPTVRQGPYENNLFDFTDDEKGLHCPVGSHIRRSNPRSTGSSTPDGSLAVTLRHRILRRGRRYRDETHNEEGLQFICFNASISRQFEFLQASWCNNQFFHGLQGEVDPVIGTVRAARHGMAAVDRYSIPNSPYRRLLSDMPTFVTVKGGAYFFMPGFNALRCLTQADDRFS